MNPRDPYHGPFYGFVLTMPPTMTLTLTPTPTPRCQHVVLCLDEH